MTTMLIPSDDPYLDADPVFGVKQSLVTAYETYTADDGPWRGQIAEPCTLLRHTFVLEPAPAG
ncbi:hypothetical protein [Streptomyces flaveolus]|uniref:hypothetical protein n=1 Tax=Streptomyces flaveolus TaxID=67297 RepID=UPI0033D61BF3